MVVNGTSTVHTDGHQVKRTAATGTFTAQVAGTIRDELANYELDVSEINTEVRKKNSQITKKPALKFVVFRHVPTHVIPYSNTNVPCKSPK